MKSLMKVFGILLVLGYSNGYAIDPESPLHDSNAAPFDELEALQLVPFVIKQLRKNSLTNEERVALKFIYGSVWELLVEEAQRNKAIPRNGILSILLAAPEIRNGHQDIRQQFTNDVQQNTVGKVYASQGATPIHLVDDPETDPAQRVLQMVAAIVQKFYQRHPSKSKSMTNALTSKARKAFLQAKRSLQQRRQYRVNQQQPRRNVDSVRVTIEVPRIKRALPSDDTSRRSDEETEAKIMAAIQAQIGNESHEDEEDDDEDDEDDYYNDTAIAEEKETEVPESAKDLASDDGDESEYLDDEADEDYELLFKHIPQDFENPSFNELLVLAARHRANRERNGAISGGNRFQVDSDSYEDYY